VWAGLGTVGTAVGAALLFGERLSITAIAGIATVIVGTTLINLGTDTGG
jgi:small multidrug resistance pump